MRSDKERGKSVVTGTQSCGLMRTGLTFTQNLGCMFCSMLMSELLTLLVSKVGCSHVVLCCVVTAGGLRWLLIPTDHTNHEPGNLPLDKPVSVFVHHTFTPCLVVVVTCMYPPTLTFCSSIPVLPHVPCLPLPPHIPSTTSSVALFYCEVLKYM